MCCDCEQPHGPRCYHRLRRHSYCPFLLVIIRRARCVFVNRRDYVFIMHPPRPHIVHAVAAHPYRLSHPPKKYAARGRIKACLSARPRAQLLAPRCDPAHPLCDRAIPLCDPRAGAPCGALAPCAPPKVAPAGNERAVLAQPTDRYHRQVLTRLLLLHGKQGSVHCGKRGHSATRTHRWRERMSGSARARGAAARACRRGRARKRHRLLAAALKTCHKP